MKFAINFSYEAAELISAGRIHIDRFKSPNWPDLIAEAESYRPVAVHFNLQAGRGKMGKAPWEQIQEMLEETGTPFVNLHLDPSTDEFPEVSPENPTSAQAARILEQMLRDVSAVTERFGAKRVIAENVPYRGAQGKTLRSGVEPEIIQRVVRETGCGLLLDIAHARIAAHYLGMDAHEYMRALPVEQVRELHFAGLHRQNGWLQDHLSVLESDWPELEWVLERIRGGEWARPWMLAFEYGGVGEKFSWRSESAVIAEQTPRLYEMVSKV